MNADQVIDSYVHAVARRLPRRKRNDIAFELRSLLTDELAARSRAEGRPADRAMAMALLREFGRPAEAAARYHPLPAVIDPADTHHFLLWSIAGAVVLSLLALVTQSKRFDGGHYLQWIGLLVIAFGLIGLWRRSHPDSMPWKPSRGADWMPRPLAFLALAGTIIFPLFMYSMPQTFVRVMFLGVLRNDGVQLSEAFQYSVLRIATIATITVLVVVYMAVVVQGGWRAWTQRTIAVAHGLLGLLLIAHAAALDPRAGAPAIEVFRSAEANRVAAPIFGLVGAGLILCALYDGYRETTRIRPAPERGLSASAA